VRSEGMVSAARFLGLWIRNPARHGHLSIVSVVRRQGELYATGRSLVQRISTECGVHECDREPLIMRRPWAIRAVAP
jgi:hypothetical protein